MLYFLFFYLFRSLRSEELAKDINQLITNAGALVNKHRPMPMPAMPTMIGMPGAPGVPPTAVSTFTMLCRCGVTSPLLILFNGF